jgi:Na+/H+ antiporter NhaC
MKNWRTTLVGVLVATGGIIAFALWATKQIDAADFGIALGAISAFGVTFDGFFSKDAASKE